MHFLLTVSFYQKVYQKTISWAWPLALFLLSCALYFSFWHSPLDYQQKETVRIMYVHVPAAWLSLSIYGFMGAMAISGFIWKSSLSFVYARAAAPIGLTFAGICLATGSVWGKPMWGTWWVWDARLTSMLVLFFMYAAYLFFLQAFSDQERGNKMGALLLILGLVNLPVIKFSVEWWSTLHQPASIMRSSGVAIDSGMLWPLLTGFFGLVVLSYALVLTRVETILMTQRLRRHLIMSSRRSL